MSYKLIPEHPKYEVSTSGFVRRIGKVFPLRPWEHASGHLYVKLNGKSRQVHHLVMEANGRIGPNGMECRHLDGNPKNNNLSNLEWGTRSENIRDYREANGKHMRTNSTTVKIAEQIKREHDGKKGTGKRLAEKYGVSVFTVSEIRTGKTFKYITL